MNRNRKSLLAILLAALLVLAVGCGSAGVGTTATTAAAVTTAAETAAATTATPADAPLVGISVPSATHGWVAATAYFAEKKAKELGLNYKLVVSASPNEQASQIDELILMKCSVIVLFPHNDEVTVAAQKVLDAGIPLVNFDRKVNVDATAYLAGDNPGIGSEGAKYIADKLGGKGKVVIVGVPSWGAINTERVDAFKAYVAENLPDIEIINEYGANTAAAQDGLKVMADALTANPSIDAVFSVDDELSIGIQKAIEETGRADVKVVTGGGGMQSYFQLMTEQPDIWYASALYSPSMIQDCVQIAKDILDGKTPDKKTIIPSKVVDRDSAKDNLDPGSPY